MSRLAHTLACVALSGAAALGGGAEPPRSRPDVSAEPLPHGGLARFRHDGAVNAVAFLAGPQAAYITGATLHVNGGMFMN